MNFHSALLLGLLAFPCILASCYSYDSEATFKDAGLILAFLIWHEWAFCLELLCSVLGSKHVLFGGFLALAVLVLLRLRSKPSVSSKDQDVFAEKKNGTSTPPILKPLILPCRTSHTRFFPKKHSFSYSYLYLGIPIGWQGSIHSFVSADHDALRLNGSESRRGWLSVEAEDYLDRGNGHLGFQGKLHAYLLSQGERPEEYPFACLVTAPRFLGYSFNPVSFWYLYSKEMELKAMILEVNNTFDERRMYYLKATISDESNPGNETFQNGITATIKPFTHSWQKDFHVSPFNSRKGSYSLTATDPFHSHALDTIKVSNTITLSSSKGHPKLVARITSTDNAIDPSSLTPFRFFQFLASWCWVGLATYPRIVREAFKLFFKRKLYVWYRPEVLGSSIGRTEAKEEAILGKYFQNYLKQQVREAEQPLRLRYVPAGRHSPREEVFESEMRPPPSSSGDAREQELVFKILTPSFYSRFVGYAHDLEAVDREYLCAEEQQRTFWVSDPKLLPLVFNDRARKTPSQDVWSHLTLGDKRRWTLLRRMRSSPSRSNHPTTRGGYATYSSTDIRSLPLSSMDYFVLNTCREDEIREYRHAVLTVLLSNWIAFGEPALLRMVDWIVRGILAYMTSLALLEVWKDQDVLSEGPGVDVLLVVLELSGLRLWAGLKDVV